MLEPLSAFVDFLSRSAPWAIVGVALGLVISYLMRKVEVAEAEAEAEAHGAGGSTAEPRTTPTAEAEASRFWGELPLEDVTVQFATASKDNASTKEPVPTSKPDVDVAGRDESSIAPGAGSPSREPIQSAPQPTHRRGLNPSLQVDLLDQHLRRIETAEDQATREYHVRSMRRIIGDTGKNPKAHVMIFPDYLYVSDSELLDPSNRPVLAKTYDDSTRLVMQVHRLFQSADTPARKKIGLSLKEWLDAECRHIGLPLPGVHVKGRTEPREQR